MKKGYKFDRTECRVCGKLIADNWYIRHMKKEHSAKTGSLLICKCTGCNAPIYWAGLCRFHYMDQHPLLTP